MKENLKKLINQFKITIFYIAPLHLISNMTYKISRIEEPAIKNILIRIYISLFNITLEEYKLKKNYRLRKYIKLRFLDKT